MCIRDRSDSEILWTRKQNAVAIPRIPNAIPLFFNTDLTFVLIGEPPVSYNDPKKQLAPSTPAVFLLDYYNIISAKFVLRLQIIFRKITHFGYTLFAAWNITDLAAPAQSESTYPFARCWLWSCALSYFNDTKNIHISLSCRSSVRSWPEYTPWSRWSGYRLRLQQGWWNGSKLN